MSVASPQSGTAVPNLDGTLGVLFIGGLLVMALWGVTSHQTLTFFKVGTKENVPYLKTIISLLWILDTFDGVLIVHFLYYCMVGNYFLPMGFLNPTWSARTHASTLFSLLEFATALVITIKVFNAEAGFNMSWTYFFVRFSSCAAADFLLYFGLSCLFFHSETGLRRTESVLSVAGLIDYSISTGLLVVLDAFLIIVTYFTMPKKFIYIAIYFLMSKLHFNAYLATLNSRPKICEDDDEETCFSQFAAATGPIGTETELQNETSEDLEMNVLQGQCVESPLSTRGSIDKSDNTEFVVHRMSSADY